MKTFDDHLNELVQTANVADLNYQIWWIYKHERPEHVKVLNAFLGFFRVSLHAHFMAMVMALYKLGDPRPDSASVRTLLTEAEGDLNFDRTLLASARARLLCLEPIWKKIRKLRHKLFAHRDRYLDYEAVLAEVSITYNEFRDLIDQFFELLNEVLYYRQRTTWPRDKATVWDTHKMLQALKTPLAAVATFNPIIRDEQSHDRAAVRRVNELAFGRPDEADLVEALHRHACAVAALVAEAAGEVIGHIVFSPVDVGIGLGKRLAGLAPMAVMPAFQRHGVGSALVEAGLNRCAELGFDGVVVLGSPAYYSKFGFVPAHHFGLQCVYEVPPEAFMALPLPGRSLAGMSGTVRYHLAFDNLGHGGPPEEAPGTSPGKI